MKYKASEKLSKLPGSKDCEQKFEVQLEFGYWYVSQDSTLFMLLFLIQMMDWSALLTNVQLVPNWWSGVVNILEAGVAVLVDLGSMEEWPGRNNEILFQELHKVQEYGQWNPICFTCIYTHTSKDHLVKGGLLEKLSGGHHDYIVPLLQRWPVAYWHSGLH